METIYHMFNSLIASVKHLHLTTSSYAQHKNTDQFHSKMLSQYDRFMEAYIGNNIAKKQTLKNIKFTNIESDPNKIDYFASSLSKVLYSECNNNSSLSAIVDEIVEDIYKYIYLSSFE